MADFTVLHLFCHLKLAGVELTLATGAGGVVAVMLDVMLEMAALAESGKVVVTVIGGIVVEMIE